MLGITSAPSETNCFFWKPKGQFFPSLSGGTIFKVLNCFNTCGEFGNRFQIDVVVGNTRKPYFLPFLEFPFFRRDSTILEFRRMEKCPFFFHIVFSIKTYSRCLSILHYCLCCFYLRTFRTLQYGHETESEITYLSNTLRVGFQMVFGAGFDPKTVVETNQLHERTKINMQPEKMSSGSTLRYL